MNCGSRFVATAGDSVEVTFPLELPFLRLRTVDGLPTMIAAFTTDIPKLTNWGEPLLIGPGSIHVAHTDGEYIEKKATGGGDRFVLQDREAASELIWAVDFSEIFLPAISEN